jgi:hypothetical protein
MDPFHERLARVALEVASSYGFALAGGYAVQAHGFLDRPSADVDLFAEASAQFNFPEAVDAVIAAYHRDGLEARADARSSSFARLSVSSGEEQARVELGVDWRMNEPIRFAVGPVLHADDAVIEALEAVDRIPDAGFAAYGLDPARASALRTRMHAWAQKISRS